MPLRRIVCIGHGALGRGILGSPLICTAGALFQMPVVFVEVVEKPVVPLGRVVGPGALQPAGDRVVALAAAKVVLPAETLLLQAGALRFGADVLGIRGGTMGLADRVAADDERNGLLVIHRHAAERLANVLCCKGRVRDAARPLRVHVDQAHVIGAERPLDLPLAGVALIARPAAAEPAAFWAPEDLVGLLAVLPPKAEAERLEAHRFIRTVAGEDDQVGPGDLVAVLLLHRPEQPARLVEARVVGPTVEGSKALHAAAAAAPAVGDAVRARGMPRHPDKERPVVAVVGRPPLLRGRHQLEEVPLQRFDVKFLELLRVVEILAHRIGPGSVRAENREIQLIRPPVLVRPGPSPLGSRRGDCWVLAFAALLSTWFFSFLVCSFQLMADGKYYCLPLITASIRKEDNNCEKCLPIHLLNLCDRLYLS